MTQVGLELIAILYWTELYCLISKVQISNLPRSTVKTNRLDRVAQAKDGGRGSQSSHIVYLQEATSWQLEASTGLLLASEVPGGLLEMIFLSQAGEAHTKNLYVPCCILLYLLDVSISDMRLRIAMATRLSS